ncbi:MAG: type IV secretion system protein VirB3 [Hyphomicrobiaceae bacterium]
MAEQTRLFLGLVRPPKFLWLPIMYAMAWLCGSVLVLVWVQHWVVVAIAAITYPLLWLAADWDENFLDVVATVSRTTRRTRNKHIHGGNSYAP